MWRRFTSMCWPVERRDRSEYITCWPCLSLLVISNFVLYWQLEPHNQTKIRPSKKYHHRRRSPTNWLVYCHMWIHRSTVVSISSSLKTIQNNNQNKIIPIDFYSFSDTMEIDLRLKIIKYKHALGGRLPKHSYIFGIDRSARSNNQDLIVPHDVLVRYVRQISI